MDKPDDTLTLFQQYCRGDLTLGQWYQRVVKLPAEELVRRLGGSEWFANKIEVPGETIYEVITEEDKTGFGIAVVEIVHSQPHHHYHTQERYVLVEGALEVYLPGQRVRLEKAGESVMIPCAATHSARGIYGPARVIAVTIPAWASSDHAHYLSR